MSAPDPNGTITLPSVFIDLCSYAGELSGWMAPTLIGAITALGIAAAVWFGRKRRREGRPRRAFWWTSGIAIGVGVLLTLALAVNSWVGYVPSFAALGRWIGGSAQGVDTYTKLSNGDREQTTTSHGTSYQVTIPGRSVNVPDATAWVYVPPGYDQQPGQSYQLVVGLHGDPGKGADWFAAGDVQKSLDELINSKALPPIIFVSPDLASGLGVDYREPVNVPGGPAIADFVANDVVKWSDAELRTKRGVENRIISGFSSGGFGALDIGMRNQDVFGAIVSIIPYTVPYTESIRNDPQLLAEYNPVRVIDSATRIPPVFLGMAGLETPANGDALAGALRAKHAVYTKRVFDGQPHVWQTARIILPYGLVWAAQQLGWVQPIAGDMAAFPQSCQPDPN